MLKMQINAKGAKIKAKSCMSDKCNGWSEWRTASLPRKKEEV
jgi:hypothetical protein